MPRHMRLDEQDKRALRALDSDFVISADGERDLITLQREPGRAPSLRSTSGRIKCLLHRNCCFVCGAS